MGKGNMYKEVTKTANPLGGECIHNCTYCYVRKMKIRYSILKNKYSGEPRIIESEFKKKFKTEDTVFVCDCTDLFADNISSEIILDILNYYSQFESKFLFQTKNPARLFGFKEYFPRNTIIGTTIESNYPYNHLTSPKNRALYLSRLTHYFDCFITIEPIMFFDLTEFVNIIKLSGVKTVNIGADSGRNNLKEPSKEEVLQLISELEKFTTVIRKKNLSRLLK
jgi:DNA repair photolyase